MRQLSVSLEITPPAEPRSAVLLRRANALGAIPQFINVIHRTDRWPSLDASIALRHSGLEPVWHLANRGRRAHQIEAEISRAKAAGLRRVLCIRGEYKARDGLETPKIREVVRTLRRRIPDARIGVTLDHHQSAPQVEQNLLAKLEAGADSVQTQLTFELDTILRSCEALKSDRPSLVICPMLMPVLSADSLLRLCHRLSISTPPQLLRALSRHGEEAGWDHFTRLIDTIRTSPLLDGVALMTPMDMDEVFAARLARAISAR